MLSEIILFCLCLGRRMRKAGGNYVTGNGVQDRSIGGSAMCQAGLLKDMNTLFTNGFMKCFYDRS